MTHNPDPDCRCRLCTTMNEPLSLEGDIRYLKAHIETKDRQLAEKDNALYDAEFRIRIYRDAVIDAENENKRLREENERLKVELEASRGQVRNQLGIILDLKKEVMMMRDIESDQIAEIIDLEGRMKAVSTTLADAIAQLKVD